VDGEGEAGQLGGFDSGVEDPTAAWAKHDDGGAGRCLLRRGGPGRKAAAVSSRAASAEVSTAVLGLERSLPGNVLADLFLAFVPGFFDFDSDSGNVDLSTACSSSASGASRQGRRAPRQASSASVPNSGSQWSARRRQLPVAIYSPGSSVGAADIFRHGRPA
jgi:hypothetical protein